MARQQAGSTWQYHQFEARRYKGRMSIARLRKLMKLLVDRGRLTIGRVVYRDGRGFRSLYSAFCPAHISITVYASSRFLMVTIMSETLFEARTLADVLADELQPRTLIRRGQSSRNAHLQ